jgi:hypothetical protein
LPREERERALPERARRGVRARSVVRFAGVAERRRGRIPLLVDGGESR